MSWKEICTARFKQYNYDQLKLLPVSFSRQILPGTFEHTLNYIVDHELDLSIFISCYHNDETGAPAYDPAILLKIVLYAYSRGITSSREIEQCCRENIIFMALSADSQPHFTTIASFISGMGDEIMPLFLEVLMICDEMGLIGKELFAIPQGDFLRGVDWLQAAVERIEGMEPSQVRADEKDRKDAARDSCDAREFPGNRSG